MSDLGLAFIAAACLVLPAEDTVPSPWDVAAPPLPLVDVGLATDEGTWMSLDVSPDGREIVFDLLGDLYAIPIEGGAARALSRGLAWDMQPCYSPDGKTIAFTSDQGGGDNLWRMDRDGANRRAVTKETFRLLNAPAWSPDGQYLAGRKHFTSRRSLGAGEIWLYHESGGDGLQLTTKPTDQKDVGEPAFSPDGRYLYYSLDASPGPTFEYSKDSNDQIYAIHRLDRSTGETVPLVTGPGGACRPTPSPDGRWLAFVRRVRFETRLFLFDLDSGAVRALCGGLERDNQETWAIHGVYPAMSWTPDGAAIVFWAGGKIRRVEVATGAVSVIPFRVESTIQRSTAVRFPIEVAPDPFPVKALRWVETSPTGDRVAYQALGHIYVKDLPDGAPRRLTTQSDHFEFFPSFSRNGQSIVYTTWNDAALGSVRIAPAAGGGEGRVLTEAPGHYVEPALSPDGLRVVFRKVAGGQITSPLYGLDLGIYQVPSAGGKAELVTKTGARPQFGADSERIFLTLDEQQKDADRHALVSVDWHGGDLRTHFASDNATEFRVSPDGKWLAFVEGYNAYVTPFVPTGREVKVGPKSTAAPTARVTRDAGENLHWSGDSRRLHWSLGPELYTRELKDSFAFIAGAPESLPEPPASGVDIAFQKAAAKPAGAIALVGARLVTMKGDEVIEDGVVVVEGNRISAVGRRGAVAIPDGALVHDATGSTVVPGIIDVHAHGSQAENDLTPQRNWIHFAHLAFGITTVHDPSNDTNAIFAAAELARAGLITSPRTFSTGTILYGAAGSYKAEVETLDDARSHLRRLKAVGAFSVKSYNQPRRDQRQKILAAARELSMMVVPEGGSTFMHNLTMVVDGHTGIEHSLPVERIYGDVLQLWKGSGVGMTPTLVVAYGGIWGENYWYDTTDVWKNEQLLRFVPRTIVDPRSRRRIKAPAEEYNHLRSAAINKALVDAGERVQLGAHGQLAGLAAHWELWMLHQGGLTPMQALRAATLDGARYLGLDRDLGSLEPGKLADLLVLAKNPLEDIQNSTSVKFTMSNGRLYDAATMAAADGGPETAPVFFFSGENGALAVPPRDGCCQH